MKIDILLVLIVAVVFRTCHPLLALETFFNKVDEVCLRLVPVIRVLSGPYGGYIL